MLDNHQSENLLERCRERSTSAKRKKSMMKKQTAPILIVIAIVMVGIAACGSPRNERPVAMLAPVTVAPETADDSGATAALPAPTPASVIPTPTPQPLPPQPPAFDPTTMSITLEPFATGFNRPVFLTHAGDGSQRLYVVERGGIIRVLEDGRTAPIPFLDLSERVNDGRSEQGLLGMAFDPNFAETGRFFVNYTAADDATIIARMSVLDGDPSLADPASYEQILRIEQPARNHNAGMLAFGPDGYLYVGLGDGGGAGDEYGNGQNPSSLLGKMLRIDVTSASDQPYLIPADNPWVERDWEGVDVPDEIWSVGLRNPWRYSFDFTTGDLWLPDVGQSAFEEVNLITGDGGDASNFGWPIMEGMHCFPASSTCDPSGLVLPVAEYTHEDGNCSITGGYVYRGQSYPALDGVYFFGDYCSGDVRALRADGSGSWVQDIVYEDAGRISSFGEDAQGELYVIDIIGGTISRITMEES